MSESAWFMIGSYEVRADDLWIVATATCCSVACALVGCYLVLRRMSLLGDAISHAILPGLAIAFVVTGSREPLAMLAGALVVGVLTAMLSSGLNRWGRIAEDASMGVVFTTLFAIGVIMITWIAPRVDLDPGCVLYGLIEFVPFDTVGVLGAQVPRAFVWLGVVLLVNVSLVTLFFKELKIVCFDPYLATTMGISAVLVHYGLMTAVAATAVASFESVGSILVVAMLVAPGAAAHLLTDRLGAMLWIASAVATASAVLGYGFAVWLNTSVAGMIACVAMALFVLAVFGAPRHGVIAKHVRRLGLAARICREDMLAILFRWHERSQGEGAPGQGPRKPGVTPPSARDLVALTRTGAMGRIVLAWLSLRRVIQRGPEGALSLTPLGLAQSSTIIRGHRLWETFLAKRLGVDPDRVHAPAHATEHYLTESLRSRLDRELGESQDPHGRRIP